VRGDLEFGEKKIFLLHKFVPLSDLVDNFMLGWNLADNFS
jgi:hypothetical protein